MSQFQFDRFKTLEHNIKKYLTYVRQSDSSNFRIHTFTLFNNLKNGLPYSIPVAMFNRTIGDMKKAGIINVIGHSKELSISEPAWSDFVRTELIAADRKPKVYLAGRIRANDWRHELANLSEGSIGTAEWRRLERRPMLDGNIYVGPFFIDCDHRCYHGPNSHGAGAGRLEEGCIDAPPTEREVFEKAFKGIAACDLFFVWADKDFHESYGTLVEIGLARALGKRIVIAKHPELIWHDQWFAQCAANNVIVNESPVDAYNLATARSAQEGGK